MNRTDQLRAAVTKGMVVPTAYDAISARRVERAGFPVVHIGGFLGAAALLGMPDVGLITATEAVTRGSNIARALEIPVILDIDNGWGNAINVVRTIQDCVRGGIAGVHMEDQVIPKRCGQYGKGAMAVISKEEMVGKIRAAKYAQGDDDFYLIARTDAIGADLGEDAALDRMYAYEAAGADAVMVISRSLDTLKAVGRQWAGKAPLATAPTRFAAVSADELGEAGYSIILYTEVLARAAVQAFDRALSHLKVKHSADGFEGEMVSTEDLYEIVRLDRTRALEQEFVPDRV